MTKRKPKVLTLEEKFGKPVNVGKFLHAAKRGELIRFEYVARHTTRRKEPLFAWLVVQVFTVDFLNPNEQVKIIALAVKTRGQIPPGFVHGEYRLTLNTETGTCDIPDEIRSSGKQVPLPHLCVCGGIGEPESDQPEGYPSRECRKCHAHWWQTTCCACGKVIDSRAEITKCAHCGYRHCPHCGVCHYSCHTNR